MPVVSRVDRDPDPAPAPPQPQLYVYAPGAAGLVAAALLAATLFFSWALPRSKPVSLGATCATVHPPPPVAAGGGPLSSGGAARFLGYRPSAFEASWALHTDEWFERECEVLASPEHLPLARSWLAIARASQEPDAAEPSSADAAVLSALDFELPGGKRMTVHIEPLAGVLRDPQSVCTGGPLHDPSSSMQSKDFLYLDHAMFALAVAQLEPRGRVMLFDLGASTYVDSQMPGMSYLHDIVTLRHGIKFTDVFAWEMHQRIGAEFYEGAPPDIVEALHFYNFKAEVGAATAGPLDVLRDVATRADFVVFKLDIDNTPVEEAIIEKILSDSDLSSRIDAFFWEHHTDVKEMRPHWGGGISTRLNATHDYLTRLRQRGVLAHAWP